MPSKLAQLQAYLDGTADKDTAASIEAQLNDPGSLLSRGLNEVCGPKAGDPPFVDWHDYVFGSPAASSTLQPGTQHEAPAPQPGPTTAWTRYGLYASALAIAASLLVALGFVLSQAGRGREAAFAARVTVGEGELRGKGRAVKLSVENRTTRAAFVTVVGLRGARSPVHYEQRDGFIQVGPNQSRVFELPETFDGLSDAVVTLTATPAGDPIVKGIESAALPADPQAARERIRADLSRFGFVGAAVELVPLKPSRR